jgi:hypothetical protein
MKTGLGQKAIAKSNGAFAWGEGLTEVASEWDDSVALQAGKMSPPARRAVN